MEFAAASAAAHALRVGLNIAVTRSVGWNQVTAHILSKNIISQYGRTQ
jgi:hypothetical protein